jgi:hypothetical protein
MLTFVTLTNALRFSPLFVVESISPKTMIVVTG